MKYSTIGYLISQGFNSFGKQKKMTTASIIIMCATMLIFGIFFVVSHNLNYILKQLETQQGVKVILEKRLETTEELKLQDEIRKIDGVNQVVYESKLEAFQNVKAMLGKNQELIDGWTGEENPFNASFKVTLTDLRKNKKVQEEISKLEGIETVSGSDEIIENFSKFISIVRIGTVVIIALLVAISVFIIAYTIKLTVHARRREISIMKYVGATNSFIRGPFIVEGILIGIISAMITVFLLGTIYSSISKAVTELSLIQNMKIEIYTYSQIFVTLIAVYLGLGVGIGTVGSAISMKKYLNV